MHKTIRQIKSDSLLIGICFISAAVFSIMGLKMYDPILTETNYIEIAHLYKGQIVFGVLCELILIVSMLGSAVFMFPYLNKDKSNLGIAYIIFRAFESLFVSIGLIAVLAILSFSIAYSNGLFQDLGTLQVVGYSFKEIHKWCFIIGPNFMLAINTFIYNYAFLKDKILPKYLNIWGIFAALIIMFAALLEMFGVIEQISIWGILLAVPIAFFEMTFAVWLIVKGFRF
ncbi:MAG: DUF4386 domain-containing protein [Bacteroidetes bacterium]|nr:MAG: DUF4386 domain-containing protein [Bacteroidota bacterium]